MGGPGGRGGARGLQGTKWGLSAHWRQKTGWELRMGKLRLLLGSEGNKLDSWAGEATEVQRDSWGTPKNPEEKPGP